MRRHVPRASARVSSCRRRSPSRRTSSCTTAIRMPKAWRSPPWARGRRSSRLQSRWRGRMRCSPRSAAACGSSAACRSSRHGSRRVRGSGLRGAAGTRAHTTGRPAVRACRSCRDRHEPREPRARARAAAACLPRHRSGDRRHTRRRRRDDVRAGLRAAARRARAPRRRRLRRCARSCTWPRPDPRPPFVPPPRYTGILALPHR